MNLPGLISSLRQPVNPSWQAFLTEETIGMIRELEQNINNSPAGYTPPPHLVLRFLQIPLDEIRIIILGQDPYPQRGVATGRAFEVGTLRDWHDKYSNVSLKNILRSVFFAYTGSYLKYSEIMQQPPEVFNILPPDRLFSSWEKQGVLLLNTSFTVEPGKPGSHVDIWRKFTKNLLRFLAIQKPEIIWFLWGNHAKKVCGDIPLQKKLVSQHPMMCYRGDERSDDFLFGVTNHFAETKHLVDWRGSATDT
jgi:uracil-DNA glycosylase